MIIAPAVTTDSRMRRSVLLWACWISVLSTAAVGCRTARDNQVDLLERELRTQEDYIYELEDYVVQYSEKLRECRCSQPMPVVTKSTQPKSIVKKSKPAPAYSGSSQPLLMDEEMETPPTEPRPRSRRTAPPANKPSPITPEDIEVPDLEIGEPVGQLDFDPSVQTAAYTENDTQLTDDAFAKEDLSFLDEEHMIEDQEVQATEYSAPIEREAEQVVVAHLFRNESGGDPPSSLLAVVETLDANDEPVEFEGEVSLMVMTADAEKPLRLVRWDFTAEDALAAWQTSHLGDGLHLELPLGETQLPKAPLELWVRIVGVNGDKLLAQLPFERELLAAVDSEPSDGNERTVRQAAHDSVLEVEGRLLSAEEPLAEAEASRSGWKPSLVRSDSSAPGAASTNAKVSGWNAQPPGGRFPHLAPVNKPPAAEKMPVWTAGRVDARPPTTTKRGTQPQWSPFR